MINSAQEKLRAEVRNLNFYYGGTLAIKSINPPIAEEKITALIGPSRCGKTTFFRCFNHRHDLYLHNRHEGKIILYSDRSNIYATQVGAIEVPMGISMVFSKKYPFSQNDFRKCVLWSAKKKGVQKNFSGRESLMSFRTSSALGGSER